MGSSRQTKDVETRTATPGMPSPSTPTTLTPLKRLALATTTTCAGQATTYAKCVSATYLDIQKDACKSEFEMFAKCIRQAVCDAYFVYLTSPNDDNR